MHTYNVPAFAMSLLGLSFSCALHALSGVTLPMCEVPSCMDGLQSDQVMLWVLQITQGRAKPAER